VRGSGEDDVLAQEAIDGPIETLDRFGLAPAVTFAFVDVVFMRYAAGAEYEAAQTRYGELRRAYYGVIPEALRLGYASVVPSGLVLEDAHAYLRKLCHAKTSAPNQPLLLSLQRQDTADLFAVIEG